MENHIEKLRKKYIKNPPKDMTTKEVKMMSDDDILDIDYFLNEDDIFEMAYEVIFLQFIKS